MLLVDKTRDQDGSASLLFAVVVVPLMLVLLSVGIEVAQFFGAREEVLEHLDAEMVAALRGADSDSQIASSVCERLDFLRPYVVVDEVRIRRKGASVEGIVRGTYRGPLIEVAAQVMGGSVNGTPMEVFSRVRRPRAAALLVLDRSIPPGSDRCDDANLIARAEAVASIAEHLRNGGVANVRIGVVPGTFAALDIIGEGDSVPRCSSSDASQFGIRAVEGAPQDILPDPLSVAVRIVESLSGTDSVERRSVIMVAPRSSMSEEIMVTSFSLLENETARQSIGFQGIGVVVDHSGHDEFFSVKSSSGRSSFLRVSMAEVRSPSFETAVLLHTQGRAVIAR